MEEVCSVYESEREVCTPDESAKIETLKNGGLDNSCTSPQIQILFHLAT